MGVTTVRVVIALCIHSAYPSENYILIVIEMLFMVVDHCCTLMAKYRNYTYSLSLACHLKLKFRNTEKQICKVHS